MDEQPLNAGILGLATHKTCGIPHCCGIRWALTSPFHPYPKRPMPLGRSFSVTLLCRHRQLSVRKYGALCCPDFPLAALYVGQRLDRPAACDHKITKIILFPTLLPLFY